MAIDNTEDDINLDDDFTEPGKVEGCFLVLAASGIFLILGGLHYTTSILIVEWVEYFSVGYSVVSWIGATTAMTLIFAPVGGVLIKRFGLRKCLVISAIINGCAVCCSAFSTKLWMIYILWIITGLTHTFHLGPVLAYVMIRFHRYRSIANAFVTSSVPLGTIIFGVIINACIDSYTWRGALLVTGAIALNLIPCGLILRKWNKIRRKTDILLEKLEDKSKQTISHADVADREQHADFSKSKNLFDFEIFKQPAFICVVIPVFFLYLGVSIIYVHLVSGFRDLSKLNIEDARYLVPVLGASGVVGRFVVSLISQHPRVDVFTLFLIINLLLSVTVATVPAFQGYTAAVILAIVMGVGLSGFSGLTHLVLADIIQQKYIHMAVQYMFLPAGIGYLIGAPLAGWMYDYTGNYIYSFELAAALVSLSIMIMVPFWIKHICRKLSKNKSPSD